jgi:hypothetical protein
LIYLISYTAFSGVLFYVTLLDQDVNGWSPLRTGLSWLLMNAPFLLAAQLAGRLDRRYPPARVVAVGCVAGAIGFFALSRAGSGPAAARQAQNVAGAHVSAVTQALGPAYREAAAQAFTHGYHLAVGVGAICVLAAAVTAFLGFRPPPPP